MNALLPMSLAELGSIYGYTFLTIVAAESEIALMTTAANMALVDGDHVGAAIAMDKAERLAEQVRPLIPIYLALFAPLTTLTEGASA